MATGWGTTVLAIPFKLSYYHCCLIIITGGTLSKDSNSALEKGMYKKSDLSPSCNASKEERESTSNTYQMTSKFSSTNDSGSAAEPETKVDLGALRAASARGSSKKTQCHVKIAPANQSADMTVFKTKKSDVRFEAEDGDGSEHGH